MWEFRKSGEGKREKLSRRPFHFCCRPPVFSAHLFRSFDTYFMQARIIIIFYFPGKLSFTLPTFLHAFAFWSHTYRELK